MVCRLVALASRKPPARVPATHWGTGRQTPWELDVVPGHVPGRLLLGCGGRSLGAHWGVTEQPVLLAGISQPRKKGPWALEQQPRPPAVPPQPSPAPSTDHACHCANPQRKRQRVQLPGHEAGHGLCAQRKTDTGETRAAPRQSRNISKEMKMKELHPAKISFHNEGHNSNSTEDRQPSQQVVPGQAGVHSQRTEPHILHTN